MCRLEPDIWIQYQGDIYDYVAMYINDLEIATRNS